MLSWIRTREYGEQYFRSTVPFSRDKIACNYLHFVIQIIVFPLTTKVDLADKLISVRNKKRLDLNCERKTQISMNSIQVGAITSSQAHWPMTTEVEISLADKARPLLTPPCINKKLRIWLMALSNRYCYPNFEHLGSGTRNLPLIVETNIFHSQAGHPGDSHLSTAWTALHQLRSEKSEKGCSKDTLECKKKIIFFF